jgi:hypothetical protein
MGKTTQERLKLVRRALREAQAESVLVDVVRDLKGAEVVEGFVVAVSSNWVVLRELDESLFLDGFTALRIETVKKIRPAKNRDRFVERLLTTRGQWPVKPLVGNFTTTKQVIRFIWASGELVRIYEDGRYPRRFWVGIPDKPKERKVEVTCLGPDGSWSSKSRKFDFGYTTRVSWGHLYEKTLHEVAGPAPLGAEVDRQRA